MGEDGSPLQISFIYICRTGTAALLLTLYRQPSSLLQIEFTKIITLLLQHFIALNGGDLSDEQILNGNQPDMNDCVASKNQDKEGVNYQAILPSQSS
ncbi:unnamed protein product [Vicia faba]|uniref:Uncharacterized protein n=1 Tax=Vicia faba TaxID=3906 RepID=A0AAV0Z1J3_VICFA|nr:unnamed protein product [Vicia faba]